MSTILPGVIDLAKARAEGRCRICGKGAIGGPLTFNFGREYAHTACVKAAIEKLRTPPPTTDPTPTPPAADGGDVVGRLRDMVRARSNAMDPLSIREQVTCGEAAKEITRLRAELAEARALRFPLFFQAVGRLGDGAIRITDIERGLESLSNDDLEEFIDGEAEAAITISKRSPALWALHRLLNVLFDPEEPPNNKGAQ